MQTFSTDPQGRKAFQRRASLIVSFLLFSALPSAFSQSGGSASVYGTVYESSGSVIPGANLTVTNLGTNVSWRGVSDASGNYVFPDLPIGQYKVDSEQTGFAPYEITGISVVVAQNTRVDVAMQIGKIKQTVSVTTGAPLVDTASAATEGTVERQFIDQIPLIDRDITALETIQAGTSNNTTTNGYPPELTVNGQRGTWDEWQLDGLTVNNPQTYQMMNNNQPVVGLPSPDAVQEFTMVRSGYDAQYGRTVGGQVVVATKSGTNQFHGLAFDYLRNQHLDARSFFATNKTPYHRNIFGGTAGGPIRKDKLFFFGSYQGNRTRSSPNSAVQNIVPTAAEISGDFSAFSTPIINPATGQAFQGNIIPTASLSPITQKLLAALVPLPNGPNGELIYAPASILNSDQGIGKIDAILSSKDHLSGTVFIERTSSLSELSLPALYKDVSTPYNTTIIHETHIFSPTVLNEFTIGGSHYGFTQASAGSGGQDTMDTFGSNYFIPPINHQILDEVSNNVSISGVTPSLRPGQMLQAQDSLTWMQGNHTLVFGFAATRGMSWTTTGYRASGEFDFDGYATGNPVADFMLGDASSFEQHLTAYIPHLGQDYAAYAQDTWRVRPDFTLDIGLRYVPTWFESNRNGTETIFIPGEQSTVFPTAPAGLVYPGDRGVDDNYYHPPELDVFEPRIGIAWNPSGHSNWVVRSAFGIFHQEPMTVDVSNDLTWPNTLTEALQTPPNLVYPYGSLPDPYPFYPVSTTAPLAQRQALVPPLPISWESDTIEQNAKIATMLNWNFSVQRRLGNHDVIEAAYVAQHTYHIDAGEDANPPVYIPGNCAAGQYGLTQAGPCSSEANINSRRQYAGLGAVFLDEYRGESTYDSLQLTYRHEVGQGLTLLANYTLSKAFTCATQDADEGEYFWDPFNFGANYGLASYDVPQIFNVAYAWALPWLASGHGIGAQLAKGWTASGVLTIEGGAPFTVTSGVDNSLSGEGDDHANQIGNPFLSGHRSRGQQVDEWFNTQAFVVNPVGTYGDVGNDTIRGPGGLYWDMSFFRNFSIGEHIKLQYRFDGSNIFNHTVLETPNSTVTSSAFGVIGATQNPRILQMALRLVF